MTEDSGGSGGLNAGQKTWIALGLFALLAGLAWKTMEPGKFRSLVLVVLGGLALRLLLGLRGSRVPHVDP